MKNILITGVSKGIGRNLSKHFHDLGFHIYGIYKWTKDYKEEEVLANSLRQELRNLTLLKCDLADRQAIDEVVQELGDIQLDGIINNAAEFIPNNWNDLSIESWDRSVAVNMTAPLYLSWSLRKSLGQGGSIVNIASTDANYAAYDDIGYAASKAGLISLTKSMAAALAKQDIRVNAVSPGWVDTEMADKADINEFAHYQTPLSRNASTQEIANVVDFLISEKASFVNGTVVVVDGGYSIVDYVIKKESEK